jgi:hypothetical protein
MADSNDNINILGLVVLETSNYCLAVFSADMALHGLP